MADIQKQYLDHTELVEYDTALKQWVDDEISTSLVDFTGATSSTDGAAGQVPAPDAGDEDKFLRGDGTWAAAPAASGVTGVKGDAESTYRSGNVNITPANIGLGNVGNFKAVSTVASQGLSTTEQSNARTNIGAAATADTLYKYNFASKNKIIIACSTSSDGFVEVHTYLGLIVFRTSRDSVQLSYIGIQPDVLYSWTYSISGTTITLNTSLSGGTSGFVISGNADITVTVADTSTPQTNALSAAVYTSQKLAYIADVDYVVFKGTTTQWTSLNANEKAKYKVVILTDD